MARVLVVDDEKLIENLMLVAQIFYRSSNSGHNRKHWEVHLQQF